MADYRFWGATASPYQLKMQALLDFAGCSWERWPDQGRLLAAPGMLLRLQRAKSAGTVERFPAMSRALDEYPSVPFYTRDGRAFRYDSTGLALELDDWGHDGAGPLVPEDPGMAFVTRLIDEAYDEFGLYMVHHMRWVGSARTTPMGRMTAREMRYVLPPGLRSVVARRLPRRQVRRCPYLFSVAPEGFDAGVEPALTPPSRAGFPPTHELLDEAWCTYLAAMESLLEQQPYLLGERFTLADASAYGQLGMNLVDGDATRRLESLAPRTYRWLCAIDRGEHAGSSGVLRLTPALAPLLDIIRRTFLPLMQQNEVAYESALAGGETLFNEAAFDRGRALYDGELLGRPFRAVAKSFQVAVWRELRGLWQALEAGTRDELARDWLPGLEAAIAPGAKADLDRA